MTNPNNCDTCNYKKMRSAGDTSEQHCYMFQDSPDEQCMQHTAHHASIGHIAYDAACRCGFKGTYTDWQRSLTTKLESSPIAVFARLFS